MDNRKQLVYDEEVEEFMFLNVLGDYNQLFLCKQPCRDGMKTGAEWMQEVLEGHSDRCYDI